MKEKWKKDKKEKKKKQAKMAELKFELKKKSRRGVQ